MKNYLCILLFSILIATSCHLSRTSQAAPDPEPEWVPWMIKYERGPCFGECPVYTFYLLEDMNGLIEVKYNLLEPGWYQANLDDEAVHQILMDIEPETWWNEDVSGLPEIADLPALRIVYKHKQGLRWTTVQDKLSNQVSGVLQKVEHLVTDARWVLTTNRPLDPEVAEPTDVIVHLKPDVDVHTWMKKYEAFGMRLKKRVTPNQDYYIVSKEVAVGDAADFLQAIKHDADVVGAQWDGSLTPRR